MDRLASQASAQQAPTMHEAPIRVVGVVTKARKAELYEVRLPNGKITLGHLSKTLKASAQPLEEGQNVEMELTPFDLDTGRIARKHP